MLQEVTAVDRGELERATQKAAKRLADRGLSAQSQGETLHCTYPGGMTFVVRNTLKGHPDFDLQRFLDTFASKLLFAATARGSGTQKRPKSKKGIAQ